MYPFAMSAELTDAVRSLARKEGVTLFQTLLAGFAALLSRYSGQDDLAIGSVTAGRDQPETQALLGYFLNTVVLRTDVSGDPSFRDVLKRVRNVTLETLDHDLVPFRQLIQELNAPRDLSRNPLFQVMFSLEPSLPAVDPAWHLTQMDVDTGATKYDLYLELDERRDAVLARFHYSTDLFDQATIVRMSEHWMRMIATAARDASVRVSELPLLSEGERREVVEEWNQTSVVYPQSTTIHEVFEAQCRRTPDRIAVKDSNKQLTFAQLQQRSNQLAHYLQKFGARAGTRVAICVERSCDMLVGLLGILKTGAAYVPLDPSYPTHRLQFMLADADPVVLITQRKLLPNTPANRARTVSIDGDWDKIPSESSECPAVEVHSSDTAYVLYTSGSSGKPKGVEGTHGGALNRFEWMWERYGFEAGEVSCQKTNLGFVDSVWEIFGPLLGGVASVIVPQEALVDPEELIGYLVEHHVTRMVLVPSLLRALLDHAPNLGERLPALKLWSLSGEALTWELAGRFQKACPKARLLNIYGSSEVAADVTWHEVRESAEGKTGLVPIGRPISNTQVYVLDRHGNAVPVGVRGEIYVGGAGLAQGYWRQPELTAERFVKNRIAPEKSARLYKTGDLGRWRRDGEIEYVGRIDSEVKVRGMRIDLREIETVLAGQEGIEEAVVELAGEGGEEARLVAYLVSTEEGGVSAQELRRYLRTKLPEHMVPVRYVQVEKMPLLASGKVNRRALGEAGGEALAEEGVVGPRTEVEGKLAEMWKELLKRKEVGVEQNFFELGGHSLLVLQVMARIRRMFEVELAVRTMFEEPTIAGLGKEIEKAQALGLKAQMPVLERRPRGEAGNREALLAQLDTLSADDVQSLLKRVLDAKPSALKN
jgi:amino acid adenylation domain-containing protein